METAFKNGNHELGTTLAAMQESLDDAIAATLSEGEKAALATARRRWRIFKALESATATSEGGNVNLKSFRRAYERVTPAMKRNAGPRDKFERTMETLLFLNERSRPTAGPPGASSPTWREAGEGKSSSEAQPPSPISAATRTAYRRATVAGARRWD